MTKDPPPITNLLDQEQIQLLARLLTEVIADSGYGKVTITVYNKSIVGMDTVKTYRRGNDNNSQQIG